MRHSANVSASRSMRVVEYDVLRIEKAAYPGWHTMCPSSWQRTAACCHSGRFSLMAIVLRRSVRFQKPFTVGGRATKYTMQLSSFARRYGSDVSYRFTRFLTRRGMFIGVTSFTAVIISLVNYLTNACIQKSRTTNVIRDFSYALMEHESDVAAHDRFVSAL